MSPRHTQASLAASYQLMASHLVWDLHDLLSEGSLPKREAQERLRQFVDMLQSAHRATIPVYSSSPERFPAGNARAEREQRSQRLATLSRDEELFEMVLAARGDDDPRQARSWTQRACEVLEKVEKRNWVKPDDREGQRFIAEQVEPFLRRLGRIDQLDRYRPTSRPGLERR